MTDQSIINQVLEGDTHAFSLLVERHKDRIYSLAFRFTNDINEAQDLSQDVFINIYKKLHQFEAKAKFSTWIYKVAYNMCIDWVKRNKKKTSLVYMTDEISNIPDSKPGLEENYMERQKKTLLHKVINGMDEKYKTILILFHFENLSYEDICEITGIPVKTVETRLYRGRKILRKKLTGKLGGELYGMQEGY